MSNFLVVGYGCAGKRHARILRALGHEITSVDPDPEAGADYQDLPDDASGFDGLLDCTPPDVRAGWGLPTRKPLTRFIEKPLGQPPSVPPLGKVQMGFCYRWCFTLEEFVNIIKKQTVYSLALIGGQRLQAWHEADYRSVRQRYHGVVTDSLPHSLYIARWILGELELVGAVTGHLSKLDIEVEDVAAVLLHSETGVPCYLLADYLRQPRAFWIEAVTSGGWYRWEFASKTDTEPMYWRQMQAFCWLCRGEEVGEYPNLIDGLAVQRLLSEIEEV